MKKKNLTLAIILPIFFGSLGLLYSSWIAGIKMIVINVFFGIVLAFSTSFDSPLYLLLFFLLQPLMILWSVLIAKTKNHLIAKNQTMTNDLEINLGFKALMQALVVIFFTLLIIAFTSQFNEKNVLTTNIYNFYLLEVILTIVFTVLIERKYRKEIVMTEEKKSSILKK
tara:strand:- start:31 stop:537 length:507 start_codon:yes stop_codon:yes gene_type:complete